MESKLKVNAAILEIGGGLAFAGTLLVLIQGLAFLFGHMAEGGYLLIIPLMPFLAALVSVALGGVLFFVFRKQEMDRPLALVWAISTIYGLTAYAFTYAALTNLNFSNSASLALPVVEMVIGLFLMYLAVP